MYNVIIYHTYSLIVIIYTNMSKKKHKHILTNILTKSSSCARCAGCFSVMALVSVSAVRWLEIQTKRCEIISFRLTAMVGGLGGFFQ